MKYPDFHKFNEFGQILKCYSQSQMQYTQNDYFYIRGKKKKYTFKRMTYL